MILRNAQYFTDICHSPSIGAIRQNLYTNLKMNHGPIRPLFHRHLAQGYIT